MALQERRGRRLRAQRRERGRGVAERGDESVLRLPGIDVHSALDPAVCGGRLDEPQGDDVPANDLVRRQALPHPQLRSSFPEIAQPQALVQAHLGDLVGTQVRACDPAQELPLTVSEPRAVALEEKSHGLLPPSTSRSNRKKLLKAMTHCSERRSSSCRASSSASRRPPQKRMSASSRSVAKSSPSAKVLSRRSALVRSSSRKKTVARADSSRARQHLLYLRPLPQGQGSFRPTVIDGRIRATAARVKGRGRGLFGERPAVAGRRRVAPEPCAGAGVIPGSGGCHGRLVTRRGR